MEFLLQTGFIEDQHFVVDVLVQFAKFANAHRGQPPGRELGELERAKVGAAGGSMASGAHEAQGPSRARHRAGWADGTDDDAAGPQNRCCRVPSSTRHRTGRCGDSSSSR